MGGQGGDVTTDKQNASFIGSNEPGNLIDQRRLARAVRPDHRMQLARHHVEVDVAGNDKTAKILAQFFQTQNRISHAGGHA